MVPTTKNRISIAVRPSTVNNTEEHNKFTQGEKLKPFNIYPTHVTRIALICTLLVLYLLLVYVNMRISKNLPVHLLCKGKGEI